MENKKVKLGDIYAFSVAVSVVIGQSRIFDIRNGYLIPYLNCILWILGAAFLDIYWKRNNLEMTALNETLKIIISPYVVVVVCSVIGYLFYFGSNLSGTITRGISTFVQRGIIFFGAYVAIYLFGSKIIDYMLKAGIMAYTMIAGYCIIQFGFKDFFVAGLHPYIEYKEYLSSSYLELHDFGNAMGFICLYYFLIYPYINIRIKNDFSYFKKNRKRVIMSAILMYLSYKRIAIIGAMIAGAFYILAQFICKRNTVFYKPILSMVCIVTGIISYVFLKISETGVLYNLAIQNMHGFFGTIYHRMHTVYVTLRDWTTVSPFYIGRGFCSAEKISEMLVRLPVNVKEELFVQGHCDIMYLYVDVGFWGSLAILTIVLWFIPLTIRKKYGVRVGIEYISYTIFAVITYFTDNTIGYYVFQTLYFFMIYMSLQSRIREG